MIGRRFGHYRILRQLGVTRAMKMIKELAGTKLDVDGVRVLQQLVDEGAPVLSRTRRDRERGAGCRVRSQLSMAWSCLKS